MFLFQGSFQMLPFKTFLVVIYSLSQKKCYPWLLPTGFVSDLWDSFLTFYSWVSSFFHELVPAPYGQDYCALIIFVLALPLEMNLMNIPDVTYALLILALWLVINWNLQAELCLVFTMRPTERGSHGNFCIALFFETSKKETKTVRSLVWERLDLEILPFVLWGLELYLWYLRS